jgi:phage tail sheath protein FI
MPVYLAPGVYVEEVSSGIKPIAGVGTNTAGFVGVVPANLQLQLPPAKNMRIGTVGNGVAADGSRSSTRYFFEEQYITNGKFHIGRDEVVPQAVTPQKEDKAARTRQGTVVEFAAAAVDGKEGKPISVDFDPVFELRAQAGVPVLCTTFADFRQQFGDFSLDPGQRRLAHAVYGFFNNGGTRCWVAVVADAAAIKAVLDDQFARIDEIALVAAPGITDQATQTALLDHCENEFLQDRFAILDGQRLENGTASDYTKAAIQGDLRDSSYGAIYFPWIQVAHPESGERLFVPPSGHIAGVYARVDSTRGVHKAPANETIRGALDVEHRLSKAHHAGLNPEDINVIRKFDGNITIYGAHTLAGKEDPEWRYINVRRLFLFLRESIDEGTQWVPFEPNDERLWGKIRRNVTAFLTLAWRDGALFGATPEEAFFVKCDAETNPPEVRDAGQCITEIGVAPVKPAEFVIFRISQWAGPAA